MRAIAETLVSYYRALLELARAPKLPLLDEVIALLAEVSGADLVQIEVAATEPRLRRACALTAYADSLFNEGGKQSITVAVVIGQPIGFVRLERFRDDDLDAEPFDEDACQHANALVQQLAIVAERFDHAFAPLPLLEEVRLVERRRVLEVFERHHENVTSAARELGVSRSLVYRVTRIS